MKNKDQQLKLAAVLLGLLAMVMMASPAHAATPVTACGQTLSTAGQYILAADLDCTGTLASGVHITASNVIFHLAGHTLSSSDCDGTKGIAGIDVLSGITGVQIEGGTVKGFNDGISLYSTSSRVSAVTVTNACFFGLAISGANNQLDTSLVTLSGIDGIGIGAGTGIRIISNDISNNNRLGIDIANNSNNNLIENNLINRNGIVDGEQGGVAIFFGTGNKVSNNAINNNLNGIEVESGGNIFTGNRVAGSVSGGIFVTASGVPSTIEKNQVLGSGLADMSDASATCASGADVWKANTFQTDSAGGVSDGGPGKGCIR